MQPRSGDVLVVTKAASVQFSEPILFRVIRVHDWPTYDGWVWLDGYQLDNETGNAVERRSIFVQFAGLRPAIPRKRVPAPMAPAQPRPRNTVEPKLRTGPDPRTRNARPSSTVSRQEATAGPAASRLPQVEEDRPAVVIRMQDATVPITGRRATYK